MNYQFPNFDPLQIGGSVFSEGGEVIMEIPVCPAVHQYALAFVNFLSDRAVLLAQARPLDVAEVENYFLYLIKTRVQMVEGTYHHKNEVKLLLMPDFIQLVISMIGIVRDPESNIVYRPQLHEEWNQWDKLGFDINSALEVSEKLSSYSNVTSLVNKAMKFDPEGNLEFMSSCVMDRMGSHRVCFVQKPSHPALQYLAAFVGLETQDPDPYLFSQIGVQVSLAVEAIRREVRLL